MHNGHFVFFWSDSFGLSASFASSKVSISAPSGLRSPVIIIRAVGYDRMASKYLVAVQDCFPSLGSVWIGPKALSQPGELFHLVLGVGFLFPLLYFATHQQQLLLPLHPVRL